MNDPAAATKSSFLYVTYIRTTAEKLWRGLTEPAFTRRYWYATTQDCAWEAGARWSLVFEDGRVADAGEVLEIEPFRRLVLSWRHQLVPELHAEGFSRLTYRFEPRGEMVKLTVSHEIDVPDAKLIAAVSDGWPIILASLKSLLETGEPLEATRQLPAGGTDRQVR